MTTRFAQIVVGPAGSGKSTYIKTMADYYAGIKRAVHCVNMDPAADMLQYEPSIDIRDAINVKEVMNKYNYGPNGALVFCLEELVKDFSWFDEEIGEHEYDYLLVDFPGQIELFSHLNILPKLLSVFESKGYHMCVVFLLDSQFMIDPAKFLSGTLVAISAMTMLQLPHINLLSKGDLLSEAQLETVDSFLEMDTTALSAAFSPDSRLGKLTSRICEIIDQFNLVQFQLLNIKDQDTIITISSQVDMILQYYDNADIGDEDFETQMGRGDDRTLKEVYDETK